jgi:2-amino-4-hydroxy-6-hydroxymethyldihydropteridine diphosphokinase
MTANPMPYSVLIALGSNLGDRGLYLRRALHALAPDVRLVRVSSVLETEPVDAPRNSPKFLNMVVAGHTTLPPAALLDRLLAIEQRLGRHRTAAIRNAPRTIDLDLILHSANRVHTNKLTLPHPRYRQREFVMKPARELRLGWPLLKSEG